jgi:collagen type III alpha
MADLSGYTPIYVRTTGNDSTGDGSSGSPYLTAQKAFEVAWDAGSGNYVIDLGVGSFGGVNLDTAGATSWPARIAVRGVSPSQSNLGGIVASGADEFYDDDEEVQAYVDATEGKAVTVVGDSTANLGDVSTAGGNPDSGSAFQIGKNGANISLTDITAGNLNSSGGGDASFGQAAGNPGTITLSNVVAGDLSANGASVSFDYSENGPTGGAAISLTASTVLNISTVGGEGTNGGAGGGAVTLASGSAASSIAANGGYGTYGGGGGGAVTVTSSTVTGAVSTNGGGSSEDDPSYGAGAGGNVTVTSSTTGELSAKGGAGANTGSGGTVTVTSSTVGNVSTNPDGNASGGQSGNPGAVTATGSTLGVITANGGAGFSPTGGAAVSLTNCTAVSVFTTPGAGDSYIFAFGGGGNVTLASSNVSTEIDALGGADSDGLRPGGGTVTMSGTSTIPNDIKCGRLVTTNLNKGRGVNGSNILGVI